MQIHQRIKIEIFFTEMEKDGMIRKRNVVSGEGYRSILVVPDMLFSFMRCTKA